MRLRVAVFFWKNQTLLKKLPQNKNNKIGIITGFQNVAFANIYYFKSSLD